MLVDLTMIPKLVTGTRLLGRVTLSLTFCLLKELADTTFHLENSYQMPRTRCMCLYIITFSVSLVLKQIFLFLGHLKFPTTMLKNGSTAHMQL